MTVLARSILQYPYLCEICSIVKSKNGFYLFCAPTLNYGSAENLVVKSVMQWRFSLENIYYFELRIIWRKIGLPKTVTTTSFCQGFPFGVGSGGEHVVNDYFWVHEGVVTISPLQSCLK